MLVYNKYLKELGVKPTDYPFNKATEPDEDGIIPEHLWDLDWTLAAEVYAYLRAFQEHSGGVPCGMTGEEWDAILQKMIEGFEAKVKEKYAPVGDDWWERIGYTKFRKSMALLSEYWNCLWY